MKLRFAVLLLLVCFGCSNRTAVKPSPSISSASPDGATPSPQAEKYIPSSLPVFVARDLSCGAEPALRDQEITLEILKLKDGMAPVEVQKSVSVDPAQPLTAYPPPDQNRAAIVWRGLEVNGSPYEIRAEFWDDKLYARTLSVEYSPQQICIWDVRPRS